MQEPAARGFRETADQLREAQLRNPHSIALDREGRLLICDIGNHRIRQVDMNTGHIETFAGTGEPKPTPDGSPRAGTPLNGPRAIDFGAGGELFVVLREGNAVYRLEDGRWQRFAGTGEKGYTGDGGDAKSAKLSGPKAICCAKDAGVYCRHREPYYSADRRRRAGRSRRSQVPGDVAMVHWAIRCSASFRGRTGYTSTLDVSISATAESHVYGSSVESHK